VSNTNNDLQTTTQTTKDRAPRTPLKTRGEHMCFGRVSSFCSTRDTRRVTVKRRDHHLTCKSCWISVAHCVVCSSLFTASDYSFGIFKLFNIINHCEICYIDIVYLFFILMPPESLFVYCLHPKHKSMCEDC
jgi:hypothetical protein